MGDILAIYMIPKLLVPKVKDKVLPEKKRSHLDPHCFGESSVYRADACKWIQEPT